MTQQIYSLQDSNSFKGAISSFLLAFILFFFASCSYVPPTNLSSLAPPKAPSATVLPNLYPQSADHYLREAQLAPPTERAGYLLKASGRLLQSGEYSQAQSILEQIDSPTLTNEMSQEKILLEAMLKLKTQKPEQALSILSSLNSGNSLSADHKIYYYQLLAQAYANTGDAINSIQARVKLNHVLATSAARHENEQQIWNNFLSLDQAALYTLSLEDSDLDIRSWAQLARLNKQASVDPTKTAAAIKLWQEQNPSHPANQFIVVNKDELTSNPTTYAAPRTDYHQGYKIALLLPSHGRYASAGQAVHEGITAAYNQTSPSQQQQIAIKLYDTSQSPSILATYQQALQEGANFIIGPLAKNQVQQLASNTSALPIPTLALNYTQLARTPQNLYEFGLSPELEAMVAANKAFEDGHRRIAIIRPEGPWGMGVSQAFAQQWQQLGGTIVDQLTYNSKQDLNPAVKQFLHFSESKTSNRQLAKNTRRSRKNVTAHRREDIDSIFLLATPTVGRQIRPLLKFYYSGEIPVYATSMIYSGKFSPQNDRDLDGIIFCDNPWVLTEGKSYTRDARLYAVGLDAYLIATQFDQLRQTRQNNIVGATGNLVLRENYVQRALSWAQFRNGVPQLLEAARVS